MSDLPSPWGQRTVLVIRLVLQAALLFIPAWIVFGRPTPSATPTVSPEELSRVRQEVFAELNAKLAAAETKAGNATKSVKGEMEQVKASIRQVETKAAQTGSELDSHKETFKATSATLDDLKKDLDKLKKSGGKIGLPAEADPKALQELKTQLAQLQQMVKTIEQQRKESATKQELEALRKESASRKDLEQYQKRLDEQKSTSDKQGKELEEVNKKVARNLAEPTDVLVVGLHSRNLSLHGYKDVLSQVIDLRQRSLPPSCRVGFCLAEGADWDPLFQLGEKEHVQGGKKLDDLDKARTGTVDRMDGLGKKIQEQFKDSPALHRRCVVVASGRCQPTPREQFEDWKDLPTDVILICNENNPGEPDGRVLQDWYRFTRYTRGSLTLLAAGDGQAPDRNLKEQLRGCLWHLTQPLFPLKKKVAP